jgi:hypothetical protein
MPRDGCDTRLIYSLSAVPQDRKMYFEVNKCSSPGPDRVILCLGVAV